MESKFQDAAGEKERIMQEILATKTLYDAEFARVRKTFGPMLQHLDHGKTRTILFVDPLKVASAQAYGIDPVDFLKYGMRQKNLAAADATLSMVFNNASLGTLRPFIYATGTNPMAVPVTDALHQNAADIVIPKTHLTDTGIDVKGMTSAQLSSYVNYHEFFHCLHDKYAGRLVAPNVRQKREMFADVGAMMEMIRQGENPNIIDMAIAWRKQGKDAPHATVPALEGLKDYIRENGVGKLKAMTDREMLDADYKITEKAASGSFMYKLQELWGYRPDFPSWPDDKPANPLSSVPKGWDPTHALEDKAFALGHKITPRTLMLANNALQAEYAAARDKNPSSPAAQWMMILTEDTYVKRVIRTDYDKANAARGATLTAEDRQEIAFVKASKSPSKKGPILLQRGPSS